VLNSLLTSTSRSLLVQGHRPAKCVDSRSSKVTSSSLLIRGYPTSRWLDLPWLLAALLQLLEFLNIRATNMPNTIHKVCYIIHISWQNWPSFQWIGSQRERISELMNNIFLTMMYRKPRSIALDLKTLYRDAFATLNPTTLSMVMGAWKDYIDNTQPANYHGNGRSYELSINCLY